MTRNQKLNDSKSLLFDFILKFGSELFDFLVVINYYNININLKYKTKIII